MSDLHVDEIQRAAKAVDSHEVRIDDRNIDIGAPHLIGMPLDPGSLAAWEARLIKHHNEAPSSQVAGIELPDFVGAK